MFQDQDIEAVEKLNEAYRRITAKLSKVIVGQKQVIEELLVALFARGHVLLVGVPGLAKTLLIRTLADSLSLQFSRIQFTPDLMPADITGTEVIQEDKASGAREFRFLQGPVFANVILADEINRTPPKTQAALLEAMQEHQVTVGGKRHKLPEPFFVLATQNPIEQEGTYPLPEAQLDRFMFNVLVDYPSEDEELDIIKRTTTEVEIRPTPTLSADEIVNLSQIVRKVPVADHVARYALRFTRLTRREKEEVPTFIHDYVSWGAGRQGPRRAARAALRELRGHPRRGRAGLAASDHHQLQRRSGRDQAGRHHPRACRGDSGRRRCRRRRGRPPGGFPNRVSGECLMSNDECLMNA